MFDIYREDSTNGSINEYFIDRLTGKRVYTYINGVKQPVNYAKHGVSREAFAAFLKRREQFGQSVEQSQTVPCETCNDTQQVDEPERPHVVFTNDTTPNDQHEGFLSSGVYGATYNEKDRSVVGQALFSDMMLENNVNWRTLNERIKESGRANDGPNILGAGPGNELDGAMQAHIKNIELFDGLSTEYQTPEKLKEINKNINQDLGSTPTNSLYNRAFQTKAKIVDLGDRAVCAMPEKYMPERDRNRNIFKVHQVIEYPGYDVNIERIGQEWNSSIQTAHTQRSHGRRMNIPSKSKDSLLASQFGGIIPKQFGATAGLN